MWLSAYIHQNPKVAGLIRSLEDWKWSSYKEFFLPKEKRICKLGVVVDQFNSLDAYYRFVENNFEIIKRRKEIEHLLFD